MNHFKSIITCKQCKGDGTVPWQFYKYYCNRSDKVGYKLHSHSGVGMIVDCPLCGGTGEIDWVTNIIGLNHPVNWTLNINGIAKGKSIFSTNGERKNERD